MKRYLLTKVNLLLILSLGIIGADSTLGAKRASASSVRLACIKKTEKSPVGYVTSSVYNLVNQDGKVINTAANENECEQIRSMFISTGFACIKKTERSPVGYITSSVYNLVNINSGLINQTASESECMQQLQQFSQ